MSPTPTLTPPDYDRCQVMIREAHSAFRLGPGPGWKRCDKVPDFILVEVVPSEVDGLCGSMSACLECSKELPDRVRKMVQVQPIIRDGK
ncbi:hypothetical protein CPT_Sonora_092 [Stenotrophomonas phage Sonora]|nr:hypothetical protein CPT_Sonora_092 [Stenotrophomonas phage Sonora]